MAQSTPESQLSAVEVVARSDAGSYRTDEVAGTKSDLPLQQVPQSVRIVNRQAIDDLGAVRLDDVLDYAGGVSRQSNLGGLQDNIAIRGLAGNENTGMATLQNGFSANRGYNAPRDLAGVERIEILKGASAALYGSSEPGGTLNVVTKQPLWKAANKVEGSVGSNGSLRSALDSTGPLTERFAYRLNMALEKRDGDRDFVSSERQVIAPAFMWKLARDTVLDYSGELLRHAAPLDRGVVAVDNRLGAVARERFLGEPADGDLTITNQTHQFILSQQWNAHWRSRFGLSYRQAQIEGHSTEASSLAASGMLSRQRRFRDYQSDDIAMQAELIGNVQTGGLDHELLLGMESFRFDLDSFSTRANPSAVAPYAIDIHSPVYGQPQPLLLPNTDTRESQRNTAFYIQDTVKLGAHWRVMAGVRAERYKQLLVNQRTGASSAQDPVSTAPRLGLSWVPSPQWTVYANAGKSFRPNAGADVATRAFEPETGRALEVGAKWENHDKTMGASAAMFDIRKRNVLTADPVNNGYSIAAGEVRSRGLEFEFAGQLADHWRLSSSLTWNIAEISRDNTIELGGRLLNVPKLSASVLAMYENLLPGGQRYGLGAGIARVGARLGQTRTQAEANAGVEAFDLPAYTTAKLSGYLQVTPMLRLRLDIDNLTDKTYYASSYSRLWVAPGAARTVTLGLTAKF